MADVKRCKFKQENQSNASEQHQTLLKALTGNDKRRQSVHIENMQSTKMNIIQHKASAFYKKYSDVIINIFIRTCKLISHFFLCKCNWLQLHLFCD